MVQSDSRKAKSSTYKRPLGCAGIHSESCSNCLFFLSTDKSYKYLHHNLQQA